MGVLGNEITVKEQLLLGQIQLDLTNTDHMNFLKEVFNLFTSKANIYKKMYQYYKGKTDAIDDYKIVESRSNLKVHLNFIKKFVKEEVSYSLGKPLEYQSNSGNSEFIKAIQYNLSTWPSNYDSDLMKYLLIFGEVYELYYRDLEGNFSSQIIKPTHGFALADNFNNLIVFFNYYRPKLSTNYFIDVYTKDKIYKLDDGFNILDVKDNIFGEIPVSVGTLSEEKRHDTIYKDIKTLQDSFETTLSDICNEISDFRNAFLVFKNAELDEETATKMKEKGVLMLPESESGAEWLIKNINDSFIQNTMNTLEDKMYQIACHINSNEKIQSNTSSLALRARLNNMENKCSLNQNAHKDIVKNRIRFLCKFLKFKNINYDYKDINIKYTANIPQDDLMTAQILSQTPEGIISKGTGRSLFSFISNSVVEGEKVEKELDEELKSYPDLSELHNIDHNNKGELNE